MVILYIYRPVGLCDQTVFSCGFDVWTDPEPAWLWCWWLDNMPFSWAILPIDSIPPSALLGFSCCSTLFPSIDVVWTNIVKHTMGAFIEAERLSRLIDHYIISCTLAHSCVLYCARNRSIISLRNGAFPSRFSAVVTQVESGGSYGKIAISS